MFAVDGYFYGGKAFDRRDALAKIQEQQPSLTATVLVSCLDDTADVSGLRNTVEWADLREQHENLIFEPVAFDHPLWILYSSGTTGLPKPIVQGHGGIILEHLKTLSLHSDLAVDDRFFWFTTTGWMMWNYLISGLLLETTVLMYEGSPAHPDMHRLWSFAEETRMTYFGTSAPCIQSCVKENIHPGRQHDLGSLHAVGSTGAPLPPEGFQWVYDEVREDVLMASVSGGTDVCTAFVLSCPLLPVYAGELQCRGLGCKIEAFDEDGRSVIINEVGELVITEPMPSMPLYFWSDEGNKRYQESYFETFPGTWRHGDWIKITAKETCVIYGRSDSTLNRGGIRMGTSEFYRAVEETPEVLDSLVIDTGHLGSEGRLYLFVVLRPGAELDAKLKLRINAKLRERLSPRHVPDDIYTIHSVPRTLNGKKLEVPVKILTGTPVGKAVKPDNLSDPRAIDFFAELASRLGQQLG